LAKNQRKIGTVQRVLIEEVVDQEYRGRTEADAPEVDNDVYVRSESPLQPGTFVDVMIDDAAEFDLFGHTR
jgi:ribosomal protein S12 methylthiotransferase